MNEALRETFLADFSLSIEHREEGDNRLFELIARGEKDPPVTYPLTEQQRNEANEMTQRLRDLGR